MSTSYINRCDPKPRKKKMHFPHLYVEEKSTQVWRRAYSFHIWNRSLQFFEESREIAQQVNSSTLHRHPHRAASPLSSTIISSSSDTSNVTSFNHFLSHTHSASFPFLSPNSLVAITKYSGDGLRVCCFNANSILGHIETIRLFLASRALLSLNSSNWDQTHWKEGGPSFISQILYFVSKDHNKSGREVALYIHNSLTSKCLCTSIEVWTYQLCTPEYIFSEVKVKGIPSFFTAVVYGK